MSDKADKWEQAAEWVARREGVEATNVDSATARGVDAQCVNSLLRVSRRVDELAELADSAPHRVPAGLLQEIRKWTPGRTPRRSRYWLAAACCCVVLLVGMLAFLNRGDEWIVATSNGEQRTVELRDGSSITLNANTKLDVNFTAAERRIELIYGEAYFTVAPRANWPFLVATPVTGVKAVGTQFNVKYRSERVKVVVAEGVVQLMPGRRGSSGLRRSGDEAPLLKANQTATMFAQHTVISTLTQAQVDRAVSWRTGALIFEDTPLTEIVDEMNSFTAGRIVLMDERVGQIRSGGVYKIGSEDSFILAMQETLPIEAVRVSPQLTLLYYKP